MVVVAVEQCNRIVELIGRMVLPSDEEDAIAFELSEDTLKNFYFSLVAICHQTTPMNGPKLHGVVNGKNLVGWDYLRAKWLTATKKDRELVYREGLSSISPDDLQRIFTDDRGFSTIYGVRGRSLLLNKLGRQMIELNYESVQEMYDKSQGSLIRNDKKGLLQQLALFEAYSDPVMKKSLFFLSLMKNHRLWFYEDDENLGPPVDYHEVRGHLRLGTIFIKNINLLQKVIEKKLVTQKEDVEIRKATYDAIIYISKETNKSASVLHYFFWNVFRNCCTRVKPHCDVCPDSCGLPLRYRELKATLNVKGCILAKQCNSASKRNKLFEHRTITDFY